MTEPTPSTEDLIRDELMAERRARQDPYLMPTRERVLRDIANEVEPHYPLHAQWLKNIADTLRGAEEGVLFNRRTERKP